jgi:hypothetical protein
MPEPTVERLTEIVTAHLGSELADVSASLIADFAERARKTRALATDQLLNAVYLVTGRFQADSPERTRLVELLLKQLATDPA